MPGIFVTELFACNYNIIALFYYFIYRALIGFTLVIPGCQDINATLALKKSLKKDVYFFMWAKFSNIPHKYK